MLLDIYYDPSRDLYMYADYLHDGLKEQAVEKINRGLGGGRLDEIAAFKSHTVGMMENPPSRERIEETVSFDVNAIRTKLLEYRANEFDAELDIASCDTIICVGSPVKEESLPKYRELAALLGGKIACTRPVVDRELLPYKLQVGQSGVMIKPKLYIGFGVSGAVNHVTGIDAEKFIAVNKDATAPIFNYCDYGIVGDMDTVCDAMISALKS